MFDSISPLRGLAALLRTLRPAHLSRQPSQLINQVLVVVEGANDIEFLRRISAILHREDPRLPDLAELERRGALCLIPTGGAPRQWTFRLAGLNRREFHVYDREVPPETEARQQAVDVVNWRPGCRGVLTAKRALENYLAPDAIFEASGLRVEFGDQDNVAELVAQAAYARQAGSVAWEELPPRTRKRRCYQAKKWLDTRAVECMTPQRLALRDPEGEVRSWLETIARLIDGSL
jgi:hypothetical protein